MMQRGFTKFSLLFCFHQKNILIKFSKKYSRHPFGFKDVGYDFLSKLQIYFYLTSTGNLP